MCKLQKRSVIILRLESLFIMNCLNDSRLFVIMHALIYKEEYHTYFKPLLANQLTMSVK
jgi:hypothetical protein